MLKAIRERQQRWLTALIVVAIGGIFAVFLVPGMGRRATSGGAVLEVGHYRFDVREFEDERERHAARYQQAMGDSYDAAALEDTLNDLTVQVLIERSILAEEAEKLGLRVAKEEIERAVMDAPDFRGPDGRFDQKGFSGYVEWKYGSERNFVIEQRLGMLAGKMVRLLRENARVSEGEARDALRRRLQEVRIAFVVLDPDRPAEPVEVSDEQVAELLAKREQEVRDLYNQRSDTYDVPEQVRARHILLKLAPDASDAEVAKVEARARAVLKRLRAGEDFAKVAKEVSEDPGSKDKGGELGLFRRGQMVKPFEDAAFSLEPGSLSDLVRSDFGIHIIQVEEHKQAVHVPFEEVRETLARELIARETASQQDRKLAEKLAAAVRSGQSLEDAARAEELTLERSGWLRRRPDGFVPGLGAAQDLLITAFALAPGESSDRIFEVDDKLALLQVLEHQTPEEAKDQSAIEKEREQLRNQKLTVLAQSWINERRDALVKSGDLVVDLTQIRGGRRSR
jgi:peptidyl-prolyl cis-trans isomerase D